MTDIDPNADAKEALRAAISDLEKAHAAAHAAIGMIDEIADPQGALDLAKELAKVLNKISELTFKVRNRLAERIYQAEQMSLAELGKRAGVSKARADQLVRALNKRQNDGGTDQEE